MDTFLTLRKLQAVLKENNIYPRKELGQNFLVDRNIRDKIISFAELNKNDTVVEIGCGLGALTGVLAEKAGFVYGFEKDKNLADILKNKLANINNIKIEEKDFLKIPDDFFVFKENIKVIGNLPYCAASQILFKLIEIRKHLKLAVVMLPEDVAIKIIAKTGDKNFGLMAVLFSLFTKSSICHRVPGSVFYPEPEIKSVVMKIIPEEKFKNSIKNYDVFLSILPGIFTGRRKNILNVMCKSFNLDKETVLSILKQAQIEPFLRSHQLKIEEIIKLTENIAKYNISKI